MGGTGTRRDRRSTLRRAEDATLRRIFAAAADGMVVVDRDGVVCFANPAAEGLFGRPAGELVGDVFGFPLVAGATTEVDVVGRPDGPAVVEMRTAEVEWQGAPAYLALLRDITDRRRAEQERAERVRAEAERAQAETALRERDAFLAMAAHELKTPLARLSLVVQGSLRRSTRRAGPAPSDAEGALHRVDREVAHLSRLVRQLFDLALIESGEFALRPTAGDVRPVVERAARAARKVADDHTIGLALPPDPVVAHADPSVLQEVLTDLLTGFARHSPPGTALTVEIAAPDRPTREAAPMAGLVVWSHGPSVPPEVQRGLAAPQFPSRTAAYIAGPGVAIHVARRVAELHGGGLEVEFPEGDGTRLALRLPVRAGTARA